MFGTFQQSHLRIEVEAKEKNIRESLLHTEQLRQWLGFEQISPGLPEKLQPGIDFSSHIAFVTINHHVEVANEHCLRLLLSGGIDGYHEWRWGEGWIQSRLEGISLLPLNLGQTLSLLQLRQFLSRMTLKNRLNSV